jgi:hypothetical protein
VQLPAIMVKKGDAALTDAQIIAGGFSVLAIILSVFLIYKVNIKNNLLIFQI